MQILQRHEFAQCPNIFTKITAYCCNTVFHNAMQLTWTCIFSVSRHKKDIKTTILFNYYFQNGNFTPNAELNLMQVMWWQRYWCLKCLSWHNAYCSTCAVCSKYAIIPFLNISIYTYRHEIGLEKWHLPHGEGELVQLIFRERFERLTVSLDYLLLPAALIGETHVHVICNQSRKQLQWFILGIQW